jgi:uncharacterized membrane protein YraQ (UPF0718 family)
LKNRRLLFTVAGYALRPVETSSMPIQEKFRLSLRRSMDTSTIVMLAAAIVALIVIYWKSPQAAGDGLSATGALIIEIIPRMIAAFTLAGLIQAVVPQEVIVRWMGHGSGAKGILIGMTLGSVTPGGPMTHFPVVASLYKVGIGVGPLVAYLTAWSLFGLQRVIMWEIPFLGPKIVAVRIAVSFFFPLLAGWLCELIWNKFQLQV